MPDRDDDAVWADKAEPVAFPNRRAILRAGVGGFALVAASGLVLPEWLHNEAEAREGVYGGKLGGRHGKDRRGRDRSNRNHPRHRRDRDQKPDRDPPKGIIDDEGVLNIQFIFVNNNGTGSDPIGVTCYSYAWGTNTVVGEETRSVRSETGASFTTAVKHASLYIDHDRHVVWAKNPFWSYPTIEINMAAGGTSTVGPQGMEVGATLSLQRGAYKIDVQRLPDDSTYKIFTVSYES